VSRSSVCKQKRRVSLSLSPRINDATAWAEAGGPEGRTLEGKQNKPLQKVDQKNLAVKNNLSVLPFQICLPEVGPGSLFGRPRPGLPLPHRAFPESVLATTQSQFPDLGVQRPSADEVSKKGPSLFVFIRSQKRTMLSARRPPSGRRRGRGKTSPASSKRKPPGRRRRRSPRGPPVSFHLPELCRLTRTLSSFFSDYSSEEEDLAATSDAPRSLPEGAGSPR